MPDLATFEARERKRINLNLGLLFGASLILTAALVYFQKGILLIGPLGLLVAPLYWLFQRRKLSAALAGKNPVDVVDMFVADVNEMLADESSTPAFAYQALAPEAQLQAGDFENFHQQLRATLMDSIAGGLASELRAGKCERCALPFEYVPVPSGSSAGPISPALRCTSCLKLYCSGCSTQVLNGSEMCACGRTLGWDDIRIVARDRLRAPFLKIKADHKRKDDLDHVRLDAMAMYNDTGVSKDVTSGGTTTTKLLAYVTGAMSSSFPMRRVNERWVIDDVPKFTMRDDPIEQRWIEAQDQIFG